MPHNGVSRPHQVASHALGGSGPQFLKRHRFGLVKWANSRAPEPRQKGARAKRLTQVMGKRSEVRTFAADHTQIELWGPKR
jgi:hypothetical protein